MIEKKNWENFGLKQKNIALKGGGTNSYKYLEEKKGIKFSC